jgi:hypothetical protein
MTKIASPSDFTVFVDESGDHGLEQINPEYPLFVLAFCIFKKVEYSAFLPRLHQLKFRFFGHDAVVFHEREIRKAEGPFTFLIDAERRATFFEDLNELIAQAPFQLIAAVIRKRELQEQYTYPTNPYHLALTFGLERLHSLLDIAGQSDRLTHVVVERRGKREDNELELEFRRICSGQNIKRIILPLELVFVDKKANSCGLQIADLSARPIGRHVLDESAPNRAYEILKPKFYTGGAGIASGRGLKCFP